MTCERLSTVFLGTLAAGTISGCYLVPPDIPPLDVGAIATDGVVTLNEPAVPLAGGGVFDAGGGYLIAQQGEKTDPAEAAAAGQRAQQDPATPQQARESATADLNQDGFITLDEVVAMRDAGLGDREMIRRLEATGQVFRMTGVQENYFINHGVSWTVVDRIRKLSQPTIRPAAATTPSNNIGGGL